MEIVFLLLLLAASLFFLRETYSYQVPSFDTSGGPALFPRYILILLSVCIVLLIIQLIWQKRGKTFVFFEVFKHERGVFFWTLVAYLFLLNPIGFLAATILYLLFIVNYLARLYKGTLGSIKEIIVRSTISLAVALSVTYLFSEIFRIILPTGTIYR